MATKEMKKAIVKKAIHGQIQKKSIAYKKPKHAKVSSTIKKGLSLSKSKLATPFAKLALPKTGASATMLGKKPMVAPTSPDQIMSGMGSNLGTNRIF